MQMAEELFKSTLIGGFDKEDVLAHVERLKAEAWEAQEKLHREIENREEKINQLKKRLELKDDQYARLEGEIKEKYQKYVDNYESIGKLVFEAQLKADEIIAQAEKEAESIRNRAEEEGRSRVFSVQEEVDRKLAEGKKHYMAVQEEMNGIVDLINQAQKRFMDSYKEVHRIVDTMPESLRELEEEELHEISADQDLVEHMESILGEEEE